MSTVNSPLFGHRSPAEALPSSCQSSPDTLSALMTPLRSAGWCFIRCNACTESRRREAAEEALCKPVESDRSLWASPQILALSQVANSHIILRKSSVR